MYTPDGFMSAQLCRPDRVPFASGDWFKGTPEEFRNDTEPHDAGWLVLGRPDCSRHCPGCDQGAVLEPQG